MKNKIVLVIFSLIAVFAIVIVNSAGNALEFTDSGTETGILEASSEEVEIKEADKIEIVHFHATNQCWSCITLGEYALAVVEESFPEEYENGKITFQEVNVDLQENKEIAQKFGAYGSSLFLNVVKDGQDHIFEELEVWRLIYSKRAFSNYFEDKLSGYLY